MPERQSHRQNPEDFLVLEVQASVTGQRLPSDAYKDVPDLVPSLTNQGSANWGPMGWAVRYRLGEPAARAQWQGFFPASRLTFMGDEQLSTIYGAWGHALPVAAVHDHAVATGDAEIAAAGLEWLRYFFGIYELCRAPDGTVLTVGMRSGGHPPEAAATWLGWVRALAHGEDLGPWEAAGKALKLGMGKSYIPPTARGVQGSLAAAVAGNPSLPAFGMMTPLHIYRAEHGLAVWIEENRNGNTTPLMAAVWEDGRTSYLPANGGDHVRQRLDQATCRRDGDRLVYDSNLQGHQEAPLPAGAGDEMVLGQAGQAGPAPVDAGPPPEVPTRPPPEVPTSPGELTPEQVEAEKERWRRERRGGH